MDALTRLYKHMNIFIFSDKRKNALSYFEIYKNKLCEMTKENIVINYFRLIK